MVVLASGDPTLCCCKHREQLSSAGPDISLLRPELQRQWHYAKIQRLGDRQITASSDLRVWWSCDQCPCGLPHEWLTSVESRQNMDTQCPYCTNYSLCHHNSLLTVAPAVAAYWDAAKNGLTSDQVMARSSTHRHWLCPKCGHSWQTKISCKVDSQSGCPKCSKISKPWNRQPSLTQSQHPAMLEFDFERNQRAGLDPNRFTAGSHKMVHWICDRCPKGQPHLFVAPPHHRIGNNRGCPCCAEPNRTEKLASATRCSHCTLLWLQNMTPPGMMLDLSRFCQGRTKWPFGRMQAGVHGNKVLPTVQSQANLESSEQQSCPSSSSKPDLSCFAAMDPQHVHVPVSLWAIVMLKLTHRYMVVIDDSIL